MAKKKKKKETKKKFEYAAELYGVLFILIAILGLGKYGPVGRFITSFFLFLFGSLYMVFILALLVVGGYLILKREWPDFFTTKLIGVYIFTLGLLILMHCEFVSNNDGNMMLIFKETVNQLVSGFNSIMNTGNLSDIFAVGGGIIGGVFAITFDKLFSYTGMKIVAITLIAVGFSLFIGFSLFDLLKEKWDNRTPREKKEKVEKVKEEHKKVIINDGNEESVSEEKEEGKKIKISNISELTQTDNSVEEKNIEKREEKEEVKERSVTKNPDYQLPSLDLLDKPKKKGKTTDNSIIEKNITTLEKVLEDFKIKGKVVEVHVGPTVVQYELEIASGTRVNKITSINREISLALAKKDVRIEAPIPGKSAIGIEVPNKVKSMVGFKELVSSKEFKNAKSKISFCVGKDISGSVIVGNIEKMPHLLIAGATGSGKSVCINTIIMSILYHASPEEVKMIMVDPKMVELSVYNGIPHLLLPVITDAKKAAGALHWAVKEMTDRYELLAKAGVRNIEGFNEKVESNTLPEDIPEEKRTRMSQLVIILDEVADLMMVAAADVEDSIVRLAQLARAAGIHLIIATQKPTVNVITGLIKANVPSRIAFSVSSGNDSRVILDMNGAEDLLGNGDMLYAPQNLSKPVRIQGAFVSDEEVSAVVDFLKNNNEAADYNSDIETQIQNSESASGSISISGEPDNSRDQLFVEAGRLVIENQKGSIGYLQRNFRIGFNRAARIMDQLAEAGVVGPEMGTKPREIRMSISEFEELINAQ